MGEDIDREAISEALAWDRKTDGKGKTCLSAVWLKTLTSRESRIQTMNSICCKAADMETVDLLHRDTSNNVSTVRSHAEQLSKYNLEYGFTPFPDETVSSSQTRLFNLQ